MQTSSHESAGASSIWERGASLAVWIILITTLLLIPLRIVSQGYTPGGDARRHVAQVFAEKSYREIVVMRPEYTVDHSPGWEWLLRQIHSLTGWPADTLMLFSFTSLMLCVFLAPLPWLRRPEAWLCALLALLLSLPDLMMRFCQARPFMLTEGILIAILFAWSRPESGNIPVKKLVLTGIGFALSAWIHGAWYLWVFLLGAFFLAQAWRAFFWLTVCWLTGTLVGACLTGHPLVFLYQAVFIAAKVSGEHTPQWLLVGEYMPSSGEFGTLILLAVVALWRRQQTKTEFHPARSPAFWLIVIGWILGLRADRCWADWGIPGVLVWLTFQFEEMLPGFGGHIGGFKRIITCGLLAAPLFFYATNDQERRYSNSARQVSLDARAPELKGWLPESGGIFYCARMDFFYNTFYQNPKADWRYILGFEPALMPDEDLKIFRQIQIQNGTLESYQPWINKMRPGDRLAIYGSSARPDLPGLEWHQALNYLWIGRPSDKNLR